MGLHMPTSIWHSFLNIAKSGHHVITISKACSESDGCGQVGQDKHDAVTSQPSHCRLQATQDDSRLLAWHQWSHVQFHVSEVDSEILSLHTYTVHTVHTMSRKC
jgi:hypothetical protein